MFTLDSPLSLYVNKRIAKQMSTLGLETVGDLLNFPPRRYYKWGALTPIASLVEGESVTVQAEIVDAQMRQNASRPGVRLVVKVADGQSSMECTFFAKNSYMLSPMVKLLQPGKVFLLAGTVSSYRGKKQIVHPEFEQIDEQAEAARKAGRPIAVYPSTGGLPSWRIAATIDTLLQQLPPGLLPEILPAETRAAYGLHTHEQAIRLIHQPTDDTDWQTAKRTLAWQEAYLLEAALIIRKEQARDRGRELPVGTWPDRLLAKLPFDLTDGQKQVWETIRQELAQTTPMQRLLQADVGAGKTVVALLGLLQAVEAGAQAVLLVPTEVLAVQHFQTFAKLLAGFDVPLYLLTASRPTAEKEAASMALAAGEPGIVVGTHALLQEEVEIPRLGLLVVDEQHRFGVSQREKLREASATIPHLLVMTATPIPRTIAMTAFGDLDVTRMQGMPPGRKPVRTILVDNTRETWMQRIWQRAREEIDAGGRVYVICPKIEPGQKADPDTPSIEMAEAVLRAQPALQGVNLAIAHGHQKAAENRMALDVFVSGEAPLLLATTVVEVGVDVPEATMMVVLGAQQFGLAQLHQLRGRVGRGDTESIVMLVHKSALSPVARKRLEALAKISDGFELAERDLALRKEGDVLGASQSGRKSGLRYLSVITDEGIIAAAREQVEQQFQAGKLADFTDTWQQVWHDSVVWLERL